MMVFCIFDCDIIPITSAAFSWCDDIKCLARRNCCSGIASPCRLTRCWYSEESISSISRTARMICMSMWFSHSLLFWMRSGTSQKSDSELKIIFSFLWLLLAISSNWAVRLTSGLGCQFPEVISSLDAWSRRDCWIGYLIPCFDNSSEAMASDDWTAEVPVLPWPMCRKSFVFPTSLEAITLTLALAIAWSFGSWGES